MNCIPAVRKALKLEVNEKFTIKGYPGYFFFTDNVFRWKRDITKSGDTAQQVFLNLILDVLEVVKTPWKPKDGDRFYYVTCSGMIESAEWLDVSTACLQCYKVGNCFRAKKEAEKNKKRILEMLKKEGVLHE